MKILKNYPPNFQAIKAVLNPPETAIFAYGDTIYNPSGAEIPADIQLHEQVHHRQQGNNPAGWWGRYLTDRKFRFGQEVEAYAYQYQFVKAGYNTKAQKLALQEFAENLFSLYNIGLTLSQCETAIRKFTDS